MEESELTVSAETMEDDAQAPQPGQYRGRKCVRNPELWTKKHLKKRGLRQNAPQVAIDVVVEKRCCKKSWYKEFLQNTLHHFSTLTYDEQNLYLTGLMIRKEPKKSAGHKRKSDPVIGRNGRRVGRSPADSELSFSVEYQIKNERGLNQKICQKAFLLG